MAVSNWNAFAVVVVVVKGWNKGQMLQKMVDWSTDKILEELQPKD